jgi:hypothetical protein
MGMLGPFDFKSTMHYQITHPDETRWDGSPITAGAICDNLQGPSGFPLPPQCLNGDCTNTFIGTNCDSTLGFCPSCGSCSKNQPQGLPTQGDAAAVVEMYLAAKSPRWKVATRAVNEVTSGAGANQPFDYKINSTVTIGSNRSLSAAAYPNGDVSIMVTGSDSHVWEKGKFGSSFSSW